MALALTLFTASLFSVVCVYLELTDNILNYFDTLDEPLSIYVDDVSMSDIGLKNPRGLFYGSMYGVTDRDAVVYGSGKEFPLHQEYVTTEDGKTIIHLTTYSAYAAYATDEFAVKYGEQLGIDNSISSLKKAICLDKIVAEELQVNVGDTVIIGDETYQVVSVYDEYNSDDYGSIFRGRVFVAFVKDTAVFSRLYIETETSRQTYDLLLRLQRLELDANYSGFFQTYVKNLSIVNAFLIAIAVTVFVVNLLIMYAMITVILLNRKSYVCRLKTLGCTDGAVFAIYFVIVFVLLIIINIAAFFLSKLIVLNIMDICAQAFEATFTTSVNFGVAAINFGICAVLLAALCFVAVSRINNKAIIEATRSD